MWEVSHLKGRTWEEEMPLRWGPFSTHWFIVSITLLIVSMALGDNPSAMAAKNIPIAITSRDPFLWENLGPFYAPAWLSFQKDFEDFLFSLFFNFLKIFHDFLFYKFSLTPIPPWKVERRAGTALARMFACPGLQSSQAGSTHDTTGAWENITNRLWIIIVLWSP